MSDPLELVAFDIETTGFGRADVVTVAGFEVPLGSRVFVQTGGRPADDIEATLRGRTAHHVLCSVHESEAALLEAMREFVRMRFDDDDVLVCAYNGETWRGGFDLPFLRTRYASQDQPWPFVDVPYADLLPIVRDLFNTETATDDGDEGQADLETAYEVLCAGDVGALDPFADSDEAVTAFEEGAFTDIAAHNVADIRRTAAIGRVAQRYCSKADFSVKSLTPVQRG